jgi:MFS family permease
MPFFTGIKKNVAFLGIVSMLTDISSEMIFSILPLFLTNVIGAGGFILGIIEGIAESTASILKLVSGWLSDKFGRRKVFVDIGYGFSTISKIIFALANSWPVVLLGRFADRAGKGLRTAPRDAIIAQYSIKKYRGKVFGFHRMLDTAGAVLGPLIVLLIFPFLGFRPVFWLAVIPAVFAVFVLLVYVKVKEKAESKEFFQQKISYRFSTFSKNYRRFIYIAALFSITNFSYAFLLIRAQNLGAAVSLAILMYLLFNVSYLIFAMPVGWLSDKIGRKKTIVLGYIVFTLMCIGFAFATSYYWIFLLFPMYGLVMPVIEGVQKAFVSDLAPETKRGTALGIYNGVIGIALLPASLLAGALYQFVNPAAPFVFGIAVSLASSVLMIYGCKCERR